MKTIEERRRERMDLRQAEMREQEEKVRIEKGICQALADDVSNTFPNIDVTTNPSNVRLSGQNEPDLVIAANWNIEQEDMTFDITRPTQQSAVYGKYARSPDDASDVTYDAVLDAIDVWAKAQGEVIEV